MKIRYCGIALLLCLSACSGTDIIPATGSNPDDRDAASGDGGNNSENDGPNDVVDGLPANRDDAGDGGDGSCTLDPSRIDVPGNGLDEDCSGQADDDSPLCDVGLLHRLQ